MNSAAGPVVRFTRHTYNPYAQEGQSVHEWETGEAKVAIQVLASKAKHTKLLLTSNGDKAIGLEISGTALIICSNPRPRAESQADFCPNHSAC